MPRCTLRDCVRVSQGVRVSRGCCCGAVLPSLHVLRCPEVQSVSPFLLEFPLPGILLMVTVGLNGPFLPVSPIQLPADVSASPGSRHPNQRGEKFSRCCPLGETLGPGRAEPVSKEGEIVASACAPWPGA